MAHYHLIGICGTAMASLAGLLVEQGHLVTGSDVNVYPPMSTQLNNMGIKINLGYRAENIKTKPDIVVIGNAIPRGNPEVEHVLNNKWYYTSMADVIKREFLLGKNVLVVAGTHGKTTTTALAAWVFELAGLNPSFLVGGVAENFGISSRTRQSNYFVIEGDEYDTAYFDKGPKFMHYLPEVAIIGNVEFDHADIYSDLTAIKTAFKRFINLIPNNGLLVAGFDSSVVMELASNALSKIDSFGIDETGSDLIWTAKDISYSNELMKFSVLYKGKKYADFSTHLSGDFNVRNILAVIAATTFYGVSSKDLQEAIHSFKSVKRRMQVRGEVNGITIIDDFAHHPTAVRETLKAISQKYKGRRIVAIFEPRSWSSRKKVFQADYENAFDSASVVIIAPVFESFKLRQEDQFSPTELVEGLQRRGIQSEVIEGADNIISMLIPNLHSEDVVVIMSNGGFDNIHEKILSKLV